MDNDLGIDLKNAVLETKAFQVAYSYGRKESNRTKIKN